MDYPSDHLSPEERARIAPHFTDLDGPVFALVNLPETVKGAMFDPFEYFIARNKDGLLKTDFKQRLGKVSYHIPCHSRVQNIGQKTREQAAS